MRKFDDLLVGLLYNHIVYAGILVTTYELHIQPHCIRGNFVICVYAAYTTTLYTWEFDDLLVGRLYNHIVYAGIWRFDCMPHIQPQCIRRYLVFNL